MKSQKDFLCYQLQNSGTFCVKKLFVLLAYMVILLHIEYCYNIITANSYVVQARELSFHLFITPVCELQFQKIFSEDSFFFFPFPYFLFRNSVLRRVDNDYLHECIRN